jgi:5-oxoprolinase (ATP-hydrolysing) subunit A
MKSSIDINCDLGEYSNHALADKDEAIMPYISSANIATGFHSGDPLTMLMTVRLCKKYGVAVGAHPSFPDREGFGRRNMDLGLDELYAILVYQIGALKSICETEGIALHHVKPHGALYNMSATHAEMSRVMIRAIRSVGEELVLYGLSGSEHERMAKDEGHPFAAEAFADRAYTTGGYLMPRSEPGAVYDNQRDSINQALSLAKTGIVTAASGEQIRLRVDSICLHGDHEDAELLAKRLYGRLAEEGVLVKSVR